MNDQLQQQLQVLNRLYKESEHIYSKLASKLGMTDTTFWVRFFGSPWESQRQSPLLQQWRSQSVQNGTA